MANVEYCSCEKRSRLNQRQSKFRLDTHVTVNRIENSIECRRILAGISSSPELVFRLYEREGEKERGGSCGHYKLFSSCKFNIFLLNFDRFECFGLYCEHWFDLLKPSRLLTSKFASMVNHSKLSNVIFHIQVVISIWSIGIRNVS